jgi:cytochrome c
MSEWLKSPKKFAPGTKMTFAGLSNPQDRANVIAFLNTHSDSPLPLPAAPAEEAAATTPGTGPEQPGPQKAENEPAEDLKAGGGDAKPGAGPGQ